MDLLIEKGDNRTYLSRYKVITTSFEESSPSVKRNNTQIQYRNGNVDFGGWHEAKTIDYVGYYRADDIDEEEIIREKIYALLSDPDGYYITQLKNDSDNSYERPGENTGDYFDKQVNRPSHKRFYVYASSLESELVGSYGGHVLYKISATFTTMKLPYGESVPRDLDVKPNVPYYGRNLLTGTSNVLTTNHNATGWGFVGTGYSSVEALEANQTYTVSCYLEPAEHDVCVCAHTTNGNTFGTTVAAGTKGVSTLTMTLTPEDIEVFYSWLTFTNEQKDESTVSSKEFKLEKCRVATPWSPAPEDQGYSVWYLDTYYNTKNLVIPYAGTVICNQLEQGFTVEFTAKDSGSNLKISLNGIDFIAPGDVSSGDVFKLSGYEYLRNGISIVKATNKAYFKLLPGIANKISSNIHGSIRILNFQNLYA